MGGTGPSGQVVDGSQHRRERKEESRVTVMVAHPPLEELSLEESTGLLPELYEAPLAEVEHVERETESYVAWVIVLGFVAYALALYWADSCNRREGDPVIRFSVLRGFGVRDTVRTRTYPHGRCRKMKEMCPSLREPLGAEA
jgi:hypothetical protein